MGFKEGLMLLAIIVLGVYLADMWTLRAIEMKAEKAQKAQADALAVLQAQQTA